MSHNTAVLVSAHNEADFLGQVLSDILRETDAVLVVDDGSTDHTAEVATQQDIEIIRHPHNLGKGAALKTGMSYLFQSGYDGVLTLDADGQHSTKSIPAFQAYAEEHDIDLLLGTRHRSFEDMRIIRRQANKLAATMVSLCANTRISDSQTGFRYYSKHLFHTVDWPEDGFEAESAVIIRAARAGLAIQELSITPRVADGSAHSHYRTFADSWKIARGIACARFASRLEPSNIVLTEALESST